MTGLVQNTWNWVPFEKARCRDGSMTGIGVYPVPRSRKLMIFLDGGGACFNAITCSANPATFDAGSFAAFAAGPRASAGIMNRNNPSNAVRDWNFVYVPYCTGDVHSGNQPAGTVDGVPGMQQFVGYENIRQYLARIVPTFSGVSEVLLTGQSAGGFGAVNNYLQVARAFAPITVHDLDDSGPPIAPPHVPLCLREATYSLWNLDRVAADCGLDCSEGAGLANLPIHLARKFPRAAFGLLGSTGDATVRLFYGFGQNDCAPLSAPSPVTVEQYTAGLQDVRARLSPYANFGAFFFDGTAHTTLTTDEAFRTLASGGVRFTDWLEQLVHSGHASNAGP
jgi:hypothetical protein